MKQFVFLFIFMVSSGSLFSNLDIKQILHSPIINSKKTAIYFYLNGSECSCNSNAVRLKDLLKSIGQDKYKIVFVVKSNNVSEAKKVLKNSFSIDYNLIGNITILSSTKLYNKNSNTFDSFVSIYVNKKRVYNNQLSLTYAKDLLLYQNNYSLKCESKKKFSKKLKSEIFLGGNNLKKISDSIFIVENEFYNSVNILNINNEKFEKFYANQNDIVKQIAPFFLRNIDIDSFILFLNSKEKLFFNVSSTKVTESYIYSVGNINLIADLRDENFYTIKIILAQNIKENKYSYFLIENPPKKIKDKDVSINTSLANPVFSIDNLKNMYFLNYADFNSLIELEKDTNLFYPFISKFSLENNNLKFENFLSFNLPKYYIDKKLFYFNNYVSFFEFEGDSYAYFRTFNYIYNLSKEKKIDLNFLDNTNLDISGLNQKRPYEILSVSGTYRGDLGLIIQKKNKRTLIIVDKNKGNILYEKRLKKIKSNATAEISKDSIFIIETPFFKKYKFFKYSY